MNFSPCVTETAVNIGYSCKMLTDDMTEIFIVNGHTVQSVREELRYNADVFSNLSIQQPMTYKRCKSFRKGFFISSSSYVF